MVQFAIILDSIAGEESNADLLPGTIIEISDYDFDDDCYSIIVNEKHYKINSNYVDFICNSREQLNGLIAIQKMKYIELLEKADENIFGKDSEGKSTLFWGAYALFIDGMVDFKKDDIKEALRRMMFSQFLFDYCIENKMPCILVSKSENATTGNKTFQIEHFNQNNESYRVEYSNNTFQEIVNKIVVPF